MSNLLLSGITVIPPSSYEDIMSLISQNASQDEIRVMLIEKFNVKVSRDTISRFLKRVRDQRTEVAKTQLAEVIAKTATQDVEIMCNVIKDLLIKVKTDTNLTHREYLSTCAELRLWVKDRLALSGVDKPDTTSKSSDEDFDKEDYLKDLKDLKPRPKKEQPNN